MFERILIATDGSKHSEKAAEKAIELAKLSGGKIIALYVIDSSRHFPSAEEAMAAPMSREISDDIARRLQDRISKEAKEATNYAEGAARLAGVSLEKKIVEGHPADEILKASSDADLVVMGSLGRTGISRYLLGSVTEKVIRNSKKLVMVVY
jgi:nucleotide-binding universal stress UspA family protein